MAADFSKILDDLGVTSAPLIFVQSSSDWLQRIGIKPTQVLAALEERLADDGVIVMPSYPFSGWHEDYLRSKPHVDLVATPAQTGMLPELLRRRLDSHRSLDPDLPLVAWGKGAPMVVGSRPSGEDPTGAESAFARVLQLGGYHLGLGVSTNYMALVHVLDSRYMTRYRFPVLTEELLSATAKDKRGNTYLVRKKAILRDLQQRIKPGKMIDELPMGQNFFRSISLNGTLFSSWRLKDWERWACAHIEERLANGRMPCWLDDYADHMRNGIEHES